MAKRFITCLGMLCALGWLSSVSAGARVYLGQVDGTAAQPAAESQIELTHVFVVLVPIQQFANIGETVECAFFVNHGPKDVRRVRVRWNYTALGGSNAGATVGYDTKDVSGKYSPNVTIEEWPQYGNPNSQECQKMKGDIRDKQLIFSKTNEAVSLQALVERVDYADGTSWQVPETPAQPQS